MPSLADLDKAFNDLWLHTEQLPRLLEKWQELVSETIAEAPINGVFLKEFEEYMDKWEKVLSENRELLREHQEKLKIKLVKGAPKVSTEAIKKKFE